MVMVVRAAAAGCVAAAVVIVVAVVVIVIVVGKVRLAANVIKPYGTVRFTLDNPSPTPVTQSVVILDQSCTNVVRRSSDRTRQPSPITAHNTINNRRSRACIVIETLVDVRFAQFHSDILQNSQSKMANNRATKSGFAAEAQRKINSKYSEELAQECLEWVSSVTGLPLNTSGDPDNFFEVLKDGQVLCQLVNTLIPGSVKKVNTSAMAFKCMENINNFLAVAVSIGVPSQETFQSVDLWERQNLNSVVICLQSLGRKAGQFGAPSIGPKEAEKNIRNFSEDKLKAGQTIISLQYGSNKGANQSGLNFGNTRHM